MALIVFRIRWAFGAQANVFMRGADPAPGRTIELELSTR
jgi:hypothetical protein